jgi:hypothetical protein
VIADKMGTFFCFDCCFFVVAAEME